MFGSFMAVSAVSQQFQRQFHGSFSSFKREKVLKKNKKFLKKKKKKI